MGSTDSEEDRKERDKFNERLKRKDKERTRNIAIPRSDKKAYEEAAKRLKLENEREKETVILRLRIESRRKYLEKRKEDKVTELEALKKRNNKSLFEDDDKEEKEEVEVKITKKDKKSKQKKKIDPQEEAFIQFINKHFNEIEKFNFAVE